MQQQEHVTGSAATMVIAIVIALVLLGRKPAAQ